MRGKRIKKLRKLLGVKHPGRRHGGMAGRRDAPREKVTFDTTWVGDIGVQEKAE